jgi:hypothetical protein
MNSSLNRITTLFLAFLIGLSAISFASERPLPDIFKMAPSNIQPDPLGPEFLQLCHANERRMHLMGDREVPPASIKRWFSAAMEDNLDKGTHMLEALLRFYGEQLTDESPLPFKRNFYSLANFAREDKLVLGYYWYARCLIQGYDGAEMTLDVRKQLIFGCLFRAAGNKHLEATRLFIAGCDAAEFNNAARQSDFEGTRKTNILLQFLTQAAEAGDHFDGRSSGCRYQISPGWCALV